MYSENLRKRLSQALKSTGLNQIDFSRKYGISYSMLNKFLKGALDDPRISTLDKFERAVAQASRRTA